MAMTHLGNGLREAKLYEDALSVQEAELSMKQRVGASECSLLATQSNLAITYEAVGNTEKALSMERDVYSGWLKLYGGEHKITIIAANNYAGSLVHLKRFEEAKSLMRKMMPVARRVFGESHEVTLKMRCTYAIALYKDAGATLDDVREAVTTLEEMERIGRRVFGGSHPHTAEIEKELRYARAALRAREAGKSVVFVKNA